MGRFKNIFFLMIKRPESPEEEPLRINIILNWLEELKQKVLVD